MYFSELRFRRPLLLLAVSACLLTAWPAVAKPSKAELREQKRAQTTDGPDDAPPAKPAKANAGDAETRLMTRLRDQMEVTDEEEWSVIAERIKAVDELRRTLGTGGRTSLALNEKIKPNAKAAAAAQPEQEALRAALGDRLPDAEIKARLARAHEVYLRNEGRLDQARFELRAVLTIRREAVAVMAGLLPP